MWLLFSGSLNMLPFFYSLDSYSKPYEESQWRGISVKSILLFSGSLNTLRFLWLTRYITTIYCCQRQLLICPREVEKCNFCKQSRIPSFSNFLWSGKKSFYAIWVWHLASSLIASFCQRHLVKSDQLQLDDLNKGECNLPGNLNQSKDDFFVERVVKNNSWNNGDRHKIHEIFSINCFVSVITLVWKFGNDSN